MLIENKQGIDRLVNVLWRIQLQKLASLSHKFGIIRHDIARTQRCMSLGKVTDTLLIDRLIQQLIQPLREIKYLQHGISQICHRSYLLLMRERRALYRIKHFIARRIHALHTDISHFISSSEKPDR